MIIYSLYLVWVAEEDNLAANIKIDGVGVKLWLQLFISLDPCLKIMLLN